MSGGTEAINKVRSTRIGIGMEKRRIAKTSCILAAGWLLFSAQPGTAQDAVLRVTCSNVIKAAIERLLPKFERASGRHVAISYGASAELKRAIEGAAPFDVAILTTGVIEDLIKHGIITQGTRTAIAQSNLAVAIGSGAPKTDISTAAAMKQRLLSAKSITYSKDGGGVAAIQRMIESLGITADLQPKIVPQTEAGRAAESVARGENELAFAPLTEIVAVRGAQVLGLFPAEFQSPLAISSGISAKTADAQGAGALVNFLMTPASMKVIKASGMVPIPKP